MSLWDFARLGGSQYQYEADQAWQLADGLLELREGLALTPGAGLIWQHGYLAVSLLVDVVQLNTVSPNLGVAAGGFTSLESVPVLQNQVLRALRGRRPDWMFKIVVMGINEPIFRLAPGDSITGPNKGTVGTPVRWSTGSGFLTAGHVAPVVGSDVYEGGSKIGSVIWANDPTGHGAAIEPDLSVVDLLHGASLSSSLTGPAHAGPAAGIEVVASGNTDKVLGLNYFLHVPSLGGTCGDVYMTYNEITVDGDSGGPVVLSGGNQVIGHVIASSSGVTSFIQDLQYQLREASSAARHGLPGLRV